MPTADDSDSLLHRALQVLGDGDRFRGNYEFSTVGGGTQATVWHGRPTNDRHPPVAVRLTPKPMELVNRIAELINSVEAVDCPKTLATGRLVEGSRTWTVHICTWIGTGTPARDDPYALGRDIARLHAQMAAGEQDFADRSLSFERGPVPPAEQELPAWYVARHLWRDRIYSWFAAHGAQLRAQPIHGDLHWDNVVRTTAGFGFIDFDKLMHAPPVFDLAKLIATGFFQIGRSVRLQRTRTGELLDGYQSIRQLTGNEVAAIEGFAVILNEEIARLGHQFNVETYREQADAIGQWWTRRRRRNPGNPLGIRGATETSKSVDRSAQQLSLFPDAGA